MEQKIMDYEVTIDRRRFFLEANTQEEEDLLARMKEYAEKLQEEPDDGNQL